MRRKKRVMDINIMLKIK